MPRNLRRHLFCIKKRPGQRGRFMEPCIRPKRSTFWQDGIFCGQLRFYGLNPWLQLCPSCGLLDRKELVLVLCPDFPQRSKTFSQPYALPIFGKHCVCSHSCRRFLGRKYFRKHGRECYWPKDGPKALCEDQTIDKSCSIPSEYWKKNNFACLSIQSDVSYCEVLSFYETVLN